MRKKIIAFYLPQFHEFEENNKWWGKGFTEWKNVKTAKPLFRGHLQPKVPLNGYYDLSNVKEIVLQAKLAKKYNIFGFCFYHYWFEGKLLMEKPIELFIANKNIDINFCFSWANHNFHNKIEFKKRKLLLEQTYGKIADWKRHFKYLLPYFNDKRYIKVNNMPLFILYDAKSIPNLKDMMIFFNAEAIKHGYNGIHFVNTLKNNADILFSKLAPFSAQVEYQPLFSNYYNKIRGLTYDFRRVVNKDIFKRPLLLNANNVWKKIYKSTPKNNVLTYVGAYTNWDTSPRWKKRGIIHINNNIMLFNRYLNMQINKTDDNIGDFLFITAWNEWGEGAYLEPDITNGYSYLNIIKKVLEKNSDEK